MRRALTAAALGAVALAVYLPNLGDAPAYLSADEVIIALEGHAVGTTGRGVTGRFLPLFFESEGTWYPPVLVYSIALVEWILGFNEATIRLPMALAGVADVVLMYFIGLQVFRRESHAVAAAVLLAMTPAHFIHSRFAMDYLCVVPFLLGWLLCLLTYMRNGMRRHLFAAGLLLGIGFYSYVAALAVMPLYALLTAVFLYRRGERLSRYLPLFAGFSPALLIIPWLWLNPTMIGDVAMHYRFENEATTVADAARGFVTPHRFGTQFIHVYSGLLNPRFLFAGGTTRLKLIHTTQFTGVFLVPIAGMLLVGLWRTIRGALGEPGLLLATGFLVAPIAATLVNDDTAIFRALEILPFGILLAVAGLEHLETADTSGARRRAFLALWIPTIGLSVAYHDVLPWAQAFVRASTVPLAVAGLAVWLKHLPVDGRQVWHAAVAAILGVGATQLAHYFVGDGVALIRVSTALLAIVAVATLLDRTIGVALGPIGAGSVMGIVAGQFLAFHVQNPWLPRIPLVPATAAILGVRTLMGAAIVLATMLACFALGGRTNAPAWRPTRRTVAIAVGVVAASQVGYFFVDSLPTYAQRSGLAALAIVSVFAVAVLCGRTRDDRIVFGGVLAFAPITIALLQFGFFYADYFHAYRVRSANAFGSNTQGALERVIDRTTTSIVPAIFIDRPGYFGYGHYYWDFYLVKHHRRDLLERTVGGRFEPGFIRTLPAGSLIVTNARDGARNAVIDQMLQEGDLVSKEAVSDLDATPVIWILERGSR